MSYKPRPLEIKLERWLSKCKRNEAGCLIWPGRSGSGYAYLRVEGKFLKVSRIILEKKLGRPLQHLALHKCDNPACVEEAHLFEGTQQENVRDAFKKGRRVKAWGRNRGRVAQ